MRLLISAYACAPNRGSEHGVGWNWITETHRLGHAVWALVAPNHREAITRACAKDGRLAGIKWIFPKIPGWPLEQGVEPKWERTYNLAWQVVALSAARGLHRQVGFDVVHHLTWGGIRAPTFMGSLGIPLILGPLGGGETSTRSLRDELHLKARITESIRDFSNATIALNPLVRRGLTDAAVIFVKTPESRRVLGRAMQAKAIEFIELGLRELPVTSRTSRPAGPPRLLFAGRLLYWKGAHIAIRSLACLVRRMPDARLTIVGSGKESNRLSSLAARHGVSDAVEFIEWVPQEELFSLYQSHDLFVFPSLHDSSGGVVLEALSFGLPVVCLDLGGPKHIMTSGGGIVVRTGVLGTAQIAQAMADEIFNLLASPTRLAVLSRKAAASAQEFALPDRVSRFYATAREFITQSAPIEARKHP